jgi:hypothetical protein
MADKKKYDSTVARIAGNIAAGLLADMQIYGSRHDLVAIEAVKLARAIVAEVELTEPEPKALSVTWQPIATAPKDGTFLLVRQDDFVPYVGRYYGRQLDPNGYWGDETGPRPRPTTWMPLPASQGPTA